MQAFRYNSIDDIPVDQFILVRDMNPDLVASLASRTEVGGPLFLAVVGAMSAPRAHPMKMIYNGKEIAFGCPECHPDYKNWKYHSI